MLTITTSGFSDRDRATSTAEWSQSANTPSPTNTELNKEQMISDFANQNDVEARSLCTYTIFELVVISCN